MRNKETNTRGRYKSCFVLIVGLLIVVLVVGFVGYNTYNDAVYSTNSTSNETVIFKVSEGDTFTSVAKRLEDEGVIKSSEILKIYLKINGLDPQIKVGTYSLPKNKTPLEIIEMLEDGVLKPGIKVTIKEGLRHDQTATVISTAMGTASKFNIAEFNSIVETPDLFTFREERVSEFLTNYKPAGNSLEGFLYPDTYEFAEDQSTQEIVEKILSNFIRKIEANINLSNLNITWGEIDNFYDALKLASIIEKEASVNDDRAEISSVFHNRIADSIPLQSDATVNYITGKNDPGVNAEDSMIDSPYNTYRYPGLTPTPISNPRIESIKGALYPKPTAYYYFFHTDGGETFYSETFAEHSEKACQYRGC